MLKENLEILLENLQQKENETRNLKSNFDRMEEDSITTRLNYEEQIQLLTEQVLLLTSEWLRKNIIIELLFKDQFRIYVRIVRTINLLKLQEVS